MKLSHVLVLVGVAGVAWFVYKYPYAVGALLKHPAELNEAAKQLNTVANVVGSLSDLGSTLKGDWQAIEAQFTS